MKETLIFIHDLSFATVPKVSLIVRKSYGTANCNMGGAGMGVDYIYAWPTADIGFMGPEVAANVIFGAKIAASENPDGMRRKAIEELNLASAPWRAAGLNYIDDVINPRNSRSVLIRSIGLASGKNRGMSRRHMANWPTSF